VKRTRRKKQQDLHLFAPKQLLAEAHLAAAAKAYLAANHPRLAVRRKRNPASWWKKENMIVSIFEQHSSYLLCHLILTLFV